MKICQGTICSIAQLLAENKIENKRALTKPSISILLTILTANKTTAVLTTNWKSPKVKKVIGKDNIDKMGRIKVFRRLSTNTKAETITIVS